MFKKLGFIFCSVFIALVMVITAVPAFAQDKPADNMDIVREKIRADKKLLVSEVMELTEKEAAAFWPVYDAYQKDLQKINDRTMALIDTYAKNYKAMTDDMARKLLDDMMKIEADRQTVKKTHLPKFRKALSEKKVARYFQLENKIEAVVKYELATAIPLMK